MTALVTGKEPVPSIKVKFVKAVTAGPVFSVFELQASKTMLRRSGRECFIPEFSIKMSLP
jgi:hypothetical protein